MLSTRSESSCKRPTGSVAWVSEAPCMQQWREDPAALRAWQMGQTGFPLVDAGKAPRHAQAVLCSLHACLACQRCFLQHETA